MICTFFVILYFLPSCNHNHFAINECFYQNQISKFKVYFLKTFKYSLKCLLPKKSDSLFFILTKFAKCKENRTCKNKCKAQILLTYKYWYILKS